MAANVGCTPARMAGRSRLVSLTAVIGRRWFTTPRAFQKPFEDGVALLNAIQDLYLDKTIDIA